MRLTCCVVFGNTASGVAVLRGESPFDRLRIKGVRLNATTEPAHSPAEAEASLSAFCRAIMKASTVQEFEFWDYVWDGSDPPGLVVTDNSLSMLAQCAEAVYLSDLHCWVRITPAALPSIAALLSSSQLTNFALRARGTDLPGPVFCGPGMPAVLSSLRACTLKSLFLLELDLFSDASYTDGVAIIDALTGHPTCEYLGLDRNPVSPSALLAVSAALGRLVGARSTLKSLFTSLQPRRRGSASSFLRPSH